MRFYWSIYCHSSGQGAQPYSISLLWRLQLSVTLVVCLMEIFLILLVWHTAFPFHCALAASSFFTNAFVTDHVWQPFVIVEKTHWLKTLFLDSYGEGFLLKKLSVFLKNDLIKTSFLVLISSAIGCPKWLYFVTTSISAPSIWMLSVRSLFVMYLAFDPYV